MTYRFLRGTAALLLAGALAACSRDAGPAVATADRRPSAAASPSAVGPQSEELRFVACMRTHGVANMPDPTPGDTSGRSAVKTALDQMGLGNDATFQAALDACQDLLPALPAPTPVSNDRLAAEIKFAQCMRDHGMTDFHDPNPDGSWGDSWLKEGDANVRAAMDACDKYLPTTSPSPAG